MDEWIRLNLHQLLIDKSFPYALTGFAKFIVVLGFIVLIEIAIVIIVGSVLLMRIYINNAIKDRIYEHKLDCNKKKK